MSMNEASKRGKRVKGVKGVRCFIGGIPKIQTGASKVSHDSLSSFLGPGKTFFREHLTAHRASGPNDMMGGLRSEVAFFQRGCLEIGATMRAILGVMDRGWFVKDRVSTHLAKAMRGEITSPLDDL